PPPRPHTRGRPRRARGGVREPPSPRRYAIPPAMSPPRTCLEPGRRVRSARCVTADTHRTSFDRVAHCYDETRALPAEVMAAGGARVGGGVGPLPGGPG